MIQFTPSQRKIYLDIRAEQIKHRQDKENGHLFKQPYSIETARQMAQSQLDNDIEAGSLRLSMEDLLLLDNDACNDKADQVVIDRAKEQLKKNSVLRIYKRIDD